MNNKGSCTTFQFIQKQFDLRKHQFPRMMTIPSNVFSNSFSTQSPSAPTVKALELLQVSIITLLQLSALFVFPKIEVFLLFFRDFLFMYLFERVMERQREIFHVLLHCPEGRKGHGWLNQARAQSFLWGLHVDDRSPNIYPLHFLSH